MIDQALKIILLLNPKEKSKIYAVDHQLISSQQWDVAFLFVSISKGLCLFCKKVLN